MLKRFSSAYAGHVDLDDYGQDATPHNERFCTPEQVASVFGKIEALAQVMEDNGYYALWLAEHHFGREGLEVTPNVPMLAVHLAQKTKTLKLGCGLNIVPAWHPLRLAEDFATADILTGGRMLLGFGRGYHTREVETLGAPLVDQDANRALFEEQVEIVFKALNSQAFSHSGARYTVPPKIPYRGYQLEEVTLVPRPLRRIDSGWQAISSASPRGLDFMMRHNLNGLVDGGLSTWANDNIRAYQAAAERAGRSYGLGQGISLGLMFHLADTPEKAIAEASPWWEERVKMFAPLGFVRGLTDPDLIKAIEQRGAWRQHRLPTLHDEVEAGTCYMGPPEGLVAFLEKIQKRFPALEDMHVSAILPTPQAVMVEQLAWFAEAVMPHFGEQTVAARPALAAVN